MGSRQVRQRPALLQLQASLRIIADGGLREAPAFRPRLMHRVSRRAIERRIGLGETSAPWGWSIRHEVVATGRTSALIITPIWLQWIVFGPGDLWWNFCSLAVRIGLAREPYEACYLHELVWFPDFPRFE